MVITQFAFFLAKPLRFVTCIRRYQMYKFFIYSNCLYYAFCLTLLHNTHGLHYVKSVRARGIRPNL
jgi:hypothetical protein